MTNTFNSSTYIKIAMKCGAAASSIEMNTHLSRQTQTLVHIIYVSSKYIDRFVYMKNPFQYSLSRLLSIYIYIYLLILGVSSRTWLKLQHLDYICREKNMILHLKYSSIEWGDLRNERCRAPSRFNQDTALLVAIESDWNENRIHNGRRCFSYAWTLNTYTDIKKDLVNFSTS